MAAPADTAGRWRGWIWQYGGEDGYGSMVGIGELGINRIDWCVQGLRAKGMEGIGVREMGSPESLSGLFPGRIGSTATEQGLNFFSSAHPVFLFCFPFLFLFFHFFRLFFFLFFLFLLDLNRFKFEQFRIEQF
jgi:hypothetical protein